MHRLKYNTVLYAHKKIKLGDDSDFRSSKELYMKKKNIGINAILNVIKSSLSIIFPLITYPYALRVLGATNIGKVSYAQSIISYFALIATLGISTYGTREGAKRKNNSEELEQFVGEVFTINIFSTALAYILLVVTLVFVDKFNDYRSLLLLQSLSIALTTFGVDWINQVFEDYLFITVRSIFAHIICLVLLFVLVRKPDDYFAYAFLTITTNLITCVSNWFYCRKYVKIKLTCKPRLNVHMKPIMILFANAVAISIYVNVDTTMLGWIKGDNDVGMYAVASKVYTIIKTMLAAVYAVSVPRLANYAGERRWKDYKKLYSSMWQYLSIIVIPASVGLICVAEEVMIFMGGSEYLDASSALQVLAVSLIFAIFGGLVTACMNVTLGREKINLKATVISAAINFGLNFVFIPWLSYIGAAITTTISELFVLVYCLLKMENLSDYIEWNSVKKSLIHAIIGSAGIAVSGYGLKAVLARGLYRIGIIIPVCVFVYALILGILKDKTFFEVLAKAKKLMKK